MAAILENDYPTESKTFAKICGVTYTGALPEYLNRIYAVTETKWEENVLRLEKNKSNIKYLMIGEAAPETLSDEVSYFYNNCHGNWCKAIVEGIIPWYQVPSNIEEKLAELKAQGVRLINEEPEVLPGRKMAFIHPKAGNGVMIELYELTN